MCARTQMLVYYFFSPHYYLRIICISHAYEGNISDTLYSQYRSEEIYKI